MLRIYSSVMGLNITDERTVELVGELARRMGHSHTRAVEVAVRAKLAELEVSLGGPALRARVDSLLAELDQSLRDGQISGEEAGSISVTAHLRIGRCDRRVGAVRRRRLPFPRRHVGHPNAVTGRHIRSATVVRPRLRMGIAPRLPRLGSSDVSKAGDIPRASVDGQRKTGAALLRRCRRQWTSTRAFRGVTHAGRSCGPENLGRSDRRRKFDDLVCRCR